MRNALPQKPLILPLDDEEAFRQLIALLSPANRRIVLRAAVNTIASMHQDVGLPPIQRGFQLRLARDQEAERVAPV